MTLPWAGGPDVVTELEASASAFASSVAGRPVSAICNGPADWAVLAQQGGFDPGEVWGYVLFQYSVEDGRYLPLDQTHLSEAACRHLDRLSSARDKLSVTKRCTVRVAPRRVKPRECAGYAAILLALGTLAHESVHLSGIEDEGLTECRAAALIAEAARTLGVGDGLARQLAIDYWGRVYARRPAGSEYYLGGCAGPAASPDR